MRFKLRTLIVCVAALAALLGILRFVGTSASRNMPLLLGIALVLAGSGAVLAIAPPWPLPRRRPAWVGFVTRATLWGAAFAILVPATQIQYLVFVATEAVMFAEPFASPFRVRSTHERMCWVIAGSTGTFAIGVATYWIVARLAGRIAAPQPGQRWRLVGWWLAAVLGVLLLLGAGAIEVGVCLPLMSEAWRDGVLLAFTPLDTAVLIAGVVALAAGIASRLARVGASDVPRARAIPGLPDRGLWHHVGWLARLVAGGGLCAAGVALVLWRWRGRLPVPGYLTAAVPRDRSELDVLADRANTFTWLLMAGAAVAAYCFAAWAFGFWLQRLGHAVPAWRFSWTTFALWWVFLSVALVVAIPTIGLLIFPAWHLFLLHG